MQFFSFRLYDGPSLGEMHATTQLLTYNFSLHTQSLPNCSVLFFLSLIPGILVHHFLFCILGLGDHLWLVRVS